MRFLRGILIFLSLLLLLVGIGARVLGDTEPAMYTLDGHATELGIERVNPTIVSALLGKSIRIDDAKPVTLMICWRAQMRKKPSLRRCFISSTLTPLGSSFWAHSC